MQVHPPHHLLDVLRWLDGNIGSDNLEEPDCQVIFNALRHIGLLGTEKECIL